jgi:hypothetical protein
VAVRTVQVELLLNVKVRESNGAVLGRIEEIVAVPEGDELLVQEYHTGGFGFLEHMAAITLGSWPLRLLGRQATGYVIAWDQLDLADPLHPTVTVKRGELKRR